MDRVVARGRTDIALKTTHVFLGGGPYAWLVWRRQTFPGPVPQVRCLHDVELLDAECTASIARRVQTCNNTTSTGMESRIVSLVYKITLSSKIQPLKGGLSGEG